MTDDPGPEGPSRGSSHDRSARPYLAVACTVVTIEALALVTLAALEFAAIDSARVGLGASTGVFFTVFGVALGWFATRLWRAVSWARGPVVFVQLVQLGLAWNFRGIWPVALALLVAAVVVLAALLAPPTTAALTDRPADE